MRTVRCSGRLSCHACPPPPAMHAPHHAYPPCHTCPSPCHAWPHCQAYPHPHHAHPPVNRITDTCENITLPQLCCGQWQEGLLVGDQPPAFQREQVWTGLDGLVGFSCDSPVQTCSLGDTAPNEQTDTTESITFPQLHWLAVIN